MAFQKILNFQICDHSTEQHYSNSSFQLQATIKKAFMHFCYYVSLQQHNENSTKCFLKMQMSCSSLLKIHIFRDYKTQSTAVVKTLKKSQLQK